MDKACLERLVSEFTLWAQTYDWGKIIIGRDVAGYLILYGIVKGDKCFWNTILATNDDLEIVISRAQGLASEIESDPGKHIGCIEWATRLRAEWPPDHRMCMCRCTIEPTE